MCLSFAWVYSDFCLSNKSPRPVRETVLFPTVRKPLRVHAAQVNSNLALPAYMCSSGKVKNPPIPISSAVMGARRKETLLLPAPAECCRLRRRVTQTYPQRASYNLLPFNMIHIPYRERRLSAFGDT